MNITISQEVKREKLMLNEKELEKIEDEDLTLELPNKETIPCLTCKWGLHNFIALYCVKYELKPKNVYYKSEKCDKYEPIK